MRRGARVGDGGGEALCSVALYSFAPVICKRSEFLYRIYSSSGPETHLALGFSRADLVCSILTFIIGYLPLGK